LLVHRAELVENQGSKIIRSSVIGPRKCVSNCRERESKAAEATKKIQRLNYIEEQVLTLKHLKERRKEQSPSSWIV